MPALARRPVLVLDSQISAEVSHFLSISLQYLVFDTQMILGGKHRKYQVSPEEYIFAALNLYLDVVTLFLFLLQLIGLCRWHLNSMAGFPLKILFLHTCNQFVEFGKHRQPVSQTWLKPPKAKNTEDLHRKTFFGPSLGLSHVWETEPMIHIEYVSRHLSVYSSLPMIVMCYALQSALWMFTCLFFSFSSDLHTALLQILHRTTYTEYLFLKITL